MRRQLREGEFLSARHGDYQTTVYIDGAVKSDVYALRRIGNRVAVVELRRDADWLLRANETGGSVAVTTRKLRTSRVAITPGSDKW